LFVGLLFGVPQTNADFYADLFHGLDLLATPSGSPLSRQPDGTRSNGQRSGRLRILPDEVGHGYTLEFNRSFGFDSQGRPEVLDLGALEVELSGIVSATLGYTNRGHRIGNANVNANNLNYSWRGKTGVQDIEWIGTLNVLQDIEIDQFGFYDALVSISNAGSQVIANGVLLDENDLNTDFDIGPIAVRGNVLFDGLVAVLATLGVDTTPIEGLFPDSGIDRIADAIQDELFAQSENVVAGSSFTTNDFTVGPPRNLAAATGQSSLTLESGDLLGSTSDDDSVINLPEPGTLLLIGLGAAATFARRRG
jgi:hypothetical protein